MRLIETKKAHGPISEKHYNALMREEFRKRFDANDTVFLEREVTFLRAKLFTTVFAELMARRYMPFANDVPASVNNYTYKVLVPVGAAKFGAARGKDVPRVELGSKEVSGRVHPITIAYGWDINELRESIRVGAGLPELLANTARDTIERGIDEVLSFGDFSTGPVNQTEPQLSGLINNPDVLNNGITALSFWTNTTAIDPKIPLAELSKLVSTPRVRSNQRFAPDTILLPQAHFDYVKDTPFSTLNGTSILATFLGNNPGILVAPWYRLDTAGVGGVPRAIAYKRDPLVLEGVVPQEFEQMPPQLDGFEYVVYCSARSGGVKIYQPVAMQYGDFATS